MRKRKPASKSNSSSERQQQKGRGDGKIAVARGDDGSWEFIHPRGAVARQNDIEEVEQMIGAGENEIAQDELRWLLSGCHDFITAHKLLGDLALAAGDLKLARGHFGYAYQLGLAAIERAGQVDHLPSTKPANRPFFESGAGLARSLIELGKRGLARDVVARLLKLDVDDSLRLQRLLSK